MAFESIDALRRGSRLAVEELPTSAGPADYALADAGDVLGVVEAKRLTVGPEGVLTQASRYSRGLKGAGFDLPEGHAVPFLYSTNGERVMFHDVRHELNRSREVSGFHTLEALREMLGRNEDASSARLASIPSHPMMYDFQVEASAEIEKAIAARKRKMLAARVNAASSRVDRSSQAVLAKAFRGELASKGA